MEVPSFFSSRDAADDCCGGLRFLPAAFEVFSSLAAVDLESSACSCSLLLLFSVVLLQPQ